MTGKRTIRNPHGQFEWVRRLRLIYGTLVFCATSAAALLIAGLVGMNSALLNTLTVSNYGLAGSMLGSYIFGAVWDDKNARDAEVDMVDALDPIVEPDTAPGTEPPEDFAG
jgi:hypothetical protein